MKEVILRKVGKLKYTNTFCFEIQVHLVFKRFKTMNIITACFVQECHTTTEFTANTKTMHNINNESLLVAYSIAPLQQKREEKKLACLRKKKGKTLKDTNAKHK